MNRAALALLLLVGAACKGSPDPADADPRAVVFFPPARRADAARAADLLRGAGFRVAAEPTELPREKSAMSIYDVGRHPERVAEIAKLLAPVGEIEALPFIQRGSGGNSVVVWLGER